MTLTEAISTVENASASYNTAASQTANDQAAADAIQAKLDAANVKVADDRQVQLSAANAFNSALDELIAAAQAAKLS